MKKTVILIKNLYPDNINRLHKTNDYYCFSVLLLHKRTKNCVKEFLQLNWLNVQGKCPQFIVKTLLKFYSKCFFCFDELLPCFHNYTLFQQVKTTFLKNKMKNSKSLSYIGTSVWNNHLYNFKCAKVNRFRHNIQKYFLPKYVTWSRHTALVKKLKNIPHIFSLISFLNDFN